MSEQIYPKPVDPSAGYDLSRRWLVEFELIYEGGGVGKWSQSYRWKWLAKTVSWWRYHISSYGGGIKLTDQWQYARDS